MDTVIFVFGSNREGRHGAGAAYVARTEYGAKYGQAHGRQGNSYAIVTKELRDDYSRVTLDEVRENVDTFILYVKEHPELTFNVTPIGCGLAGFMPTQIAPLFKDCPENVILPDEFINY